MPPCGHPGQHVTIWDQREHNFIFNFVAPGRPNGDAFHFYCATCGVAHWIDASVRRNNLERLSLQHPRNAHLWDAHSFLSTRQVWTDYGTHIFEEIKTRYRVPVVGINRLFRERLRFATFLNDHSATLLFTHEAIPGSEMVFLNGMVLEEEVQYFKIYTTEGVRGQEIRRFVGVAVLRNLLTYGHARPALPGQDEQFTIGEHLVVEYTSGATAPRRTLAGTLPEVPADVLDEAARNASHDIVEARIRELHSNHVFKGGTATFENFKDQLKKVSVSLNVNMGEFIAALENSRGEIEKFSESLKLSKNEKDLADLESIKTELLTEPRSRVVSKKRRI